MKEYKTQKVCPKCGKKYTERPAISREDNHTEICPLCGTREALDSMGIGLLEQEQILTTINFYSRQAKGNK